MGAVPISWSDTSSWIPLSVGRGQGEGNRRDGDASDHASALPHPNLLPRGEGAFAIRPLRC